MRGDDNDIYDDWTRVPDGSGNDSGNVDGNTSQTFIDSVDLDEYIGNESDGTEINPVVNQPQQNGGGEIDDTEINPVVEQPQGHTGGTEVNTQSQKNAYKASLYRLLASSISAIAMNYGIKHVLGYDNDYSIALSSAVGALFGQGVHCMIDYNSDYGYNAIVIPVSVLSGICTLAIKTYTQDDAQAIIIGNLAVSAIYFAAQINMSGQKKSDNDDRGF